MPSLVLVYDLKWLKVKIQVLLYANDILLIFEGSGKAEKADVRAVMYVISILVYYSGLRINSDKLYVLSSRQQQAGCQKR